MIYVLGGSGLIGSKIFEHNKNVVRLNRLQIADILKKEKLPLTSKDIVVNCLANRNGSDISESRYVNFELPMNLLQNHFANVDLWVQLSSYYCEYYNLYEKHYNEYARWKFEFNGLLQTIDLKHHIYHLPHIFSPQERRGRLFSNCRENIENGHAIPISTLNQQIPIKSVEDVVKDIEAYVANKSLVSMETKIACKAKIAIHDLETAILKYKGSYPTFKVDESKNYFDAICWPEEITEHDKIIEELVSIFRSYCKI